MAYDQNTLAAIVSELRAAGVSDNGIRGILANVRDESGFDPTLRHPDQPRWGGEAHYAHGLYQEGGQEWNNYANWLKQNAPDANWQDPTLQTRFLAQNLKANYPGVWDRLNNGTPEQAAQSFVSGYLKPAAGPMSARMDAYGRGVPELASYGDLRPQPLSMDAYGNMGAQAGAAAGGALAGDPTTVAIASAVPGASVASTAPQAASPQLAPPGRLGGAAGALFGALGVDPSNIGGSGFGLTNAGLTTPFGTISGTGSQTAGQGQDAPPPMTLAPMRKSLDMRGVLTLAQTPKLGLLQGTV